MKRRFAFRWTVILLTTLTTALPQVTFAAEAVSRETMLARLTVRDVALSSDGTLRGEVTAANGQPVGATEVVAYQGSKAIAMTRTEANGQFALRDFRPGVYEIASPKSVAVYRVWNTGTAPPAAQQTTLLVEGDSVVRGQDWGVWRRVLILGGVIATSGVVGGVIGYNIKDDAS